MMNQNSDNNQFKNPYYSTLMHFQYPYYYYYYPSVDFPPYNIQNQARIAQSHCKQEENLLLNVKNQQIQVQKDEKKHSKFQKKRCISYKQHKRRKYIPVGIKLTETSLKPITKTQEDILSLKFYDPYCAFLCTPPFQSHYGNREGWFSEQQENQIPYNKTQQLKFQLPKKLRDQFASSEQSSDEQQFNNHTSKKLARLVKNCKKVQTRSNDKKKIPQCTRKKRFQLHPKKQVFPRIKRKLLPKKNVFKIQKSILNSKKTSPISKESYFSHNSQLQNQSQKISVSDQLQRMNMQLK